MTDKIMISADLDTKEVEKKLKDLEKKIKNMRGIGPGGSVSQLSDQYRNSGQEERAKRLEDFRERASAQNRKVLLKDLQTQEKELEKQVKRYEKITDLQKNLTEGGKAYEKSLEKQADALDKINRLGKEITAGRQATQMGGYSPDYGGGAGPFSGRDVEFMRRGMMGGRGIRGGLAAMGRTVAKNPLMMAGGLAAGVGLAGSAMQTGGDLQLAIRTQDERQFAAEGNIAQTLSESARLQQQKRGYEMAYYGPERMKAMKTARTRMDAEETSDIMNVAGTVTKSTLSATGIGAAIGSVLGGIVGSALPIVGTTAGATLGAKAGATVGGFVGAGTGVTETLMDDRKRSMLFDRDAYSKFIGAKGAETYQQQIEIEKQKDPMKTMAADFFSKNRDRMLSTQRAFGLSDEELFKGPDSIYSRASDASLSGDLVEQQMQQILQSGGTTSASRDGGVIAGKMARGLDLTNAASLMGQISGRSGMSAEQSKDEIIRMYAEATRMGMDESEVRNLLETSTQIAYKSGTSADQIQSMIMPGVNTQSKRGIEAAVNAFDSIKNETSEMGGLRGQFALAEFSSEETTNEIRDLMGNEDFSGFNYNQDSLLTSTPVGGMTVDNPFMRGLLRNIGVDLESEGGMEKGKDILALLRKKSMKSTSRSDKRVDMLEKYSKLQKQMEEQPMMRDILQPEAEKLLQPLGGISVIENQSFGKMPWQDQLSKLGIEGNFLTTGGVGQEVSSGEKGKISDNIDSFTRIGDVSLSGEAREFKNNVSIMNKKLEDLTDAFEKAANSPVYDTLIQNLNRLSESGKLSKEGLENYSKKIQELQLIDPNFQEQFNMPINYSPQVKD